MVEVILAPGQRTLREAVLARVCAGEDEGRLLLVPEQASHELERALCAAGGDGICLRAEVLSFTRLASRVFSLYGGVSRRTLDKGGRLIAMAQALEAVGSRLKLYGTSRRKPEFLLRMLRMLEEFRAGRIGPDSLRAAARRAEGQLALKLEELSLILESYETVCATMGQDPNDRLSNLALALEAHPEYARGRRVFALGFTDFTGQELAVLDALLGGGAGLTVALPGDGSGRGPFSLTAETLRSLKRLAGRRGVPFRAALLPDETALPPELLHLRRHLLLGAPRPFEGTAAALSLHRSESVHGACLDAAGEILRLALEEGWRWRDAAVCCTEPEVYGPVLESVFARLSIPLYRAGAEPVRSDPVIGMLLDALEAASGGMETEDVIRFLKSGLSPLTRPESDAIENYALFWRVRGRRWDETWDMPPGGFGAPLDEEARAALASLNEARARGAGPLSALRDALRDAKDTAAQTDALYVFLTDLRLAERLEELSRQCETSAQRQRAQEYAQMYETVLDALEQLRYVLGPTVRTPEDFAAMTAAVLSQYEIGTIPAGLDSVVVGGPETLRFVNCRALFLLGAEDGLLPACKPETGLLTERERARLLELGLAVAPGQSGQIDRALLAVHQVMTAPSALLYVNYCTQTPSYLFPRLLELFPDRTVGEDEPLPAALTYAAGPLAEFLASQPDAAVPEALRERAKALRARAAYRMGALGERSVQGLYGRKLYLSASRVDQYAACRCAYFLRYGLKLKAQKEAGFDPLAYGTFVHAVLEGTARQVKAEGGFHRVSPARLEEIAAAQVDAYRDDALTALLSRSERLTYLFRRSREEVLAVVRELGAELRVSDFEPAAFELEFSETGPLPPAEIQGARAGAALSGFVDRVDLYTAGGVTYVRVADYKTGRKSFDYADILCGMGLQMLLYLFTLERDGEAAFGAKLRPAGVLYVPARRPVLTAPVKPDGAGAGKQRRAEQARKGLLLSEGPALAAMEHFEGEPVYMPFRVNAKGELTGDLAGRREWTLLRAHVLRTLERMADDMAGGAVEPNPIVRGTGWTACDFCDYARVCHRASGEIAERPIRQVSREEFWKEIGEGEEDG